ncbi:hypothetical protein DFH11DRAFT_1728728 [Phellopilus nigrolimitatus]|nr:hypothetical protein DFH11DRAFT_1728728 [Phellopilus nigrolimitatus]
MSSIGHKHLSRRPARRRGRAAEVVQGRQWPRGAAPGERRDRGPPPRPLLRRERVRFARQIKSKYSYVSHLVCNAGVASFTGYNWILCAKQLCTEFVAAVTKFLEYLMQLCFFIAHFLGSPTHVMTPYKAAVSLLLFAHANATLVVFDVEAQRFPAWSLNTT